jgi:hypothetical protein
MNEDSDDFHTGVAVQDVNCYVIPKQQLEEV